MDQKFAKKLAQRAGLGRLVALVANERLVNVTYSPQQRQYTLTPLQEDKPELLTLSGRKPLRAEDGVRTDGLIVPAIMIESDIVLGLYVHRRKEDSTEQWQVIDDNVQPDTLVQVLRSWNDWDETRARVFAARLRSSYQYLTEAYLHQRPCPSLDTDWITWEQSVVEGNLHPLHKCRIALDPRQQLQGAFDFSHPTITFAIVERTELTIYGHLEAELQPLLEAAGVDASSLNASKMIVPVHEFQIESLLASSEAGKRIQILPQRIAGLAQSSTRTVTVPEVPEISFKFSLSMIIGNTDRHIGRGAASAAVHVGTSGMLDSQRVQGLRESGLEMLPETAGAVGYGDRLGVLVRREEFCARQAASSDDDVVYIMSGALGEAAIAGATQRVAESVFELTSRQARQDFFRKYTRLYLQTFLPQLLINGILFTAHGQNAIIKVSRSTKQLLGFAMRDLADIRINASTFESSTGMAVDEEMKGQGKTQPDLELLMDGAGQVFFVVHLLPFMVALRLDHRDSAIRTDAANGDIIDGTTIIAEELDSILCEFENRSEAAPGAEATRNLAKIARQNWLGKPKWPLQAYISQNMRADWSHRQRFDKLSRVEMCNVLYRPEFCQTASPSSPTGGMGDWKMITRRVWSRVLLVARRLRLIE